MTDIFGMDFYIVLGRAGKRIKQRNYKRSHVGHRQKITKEEWYISELGGTLLK